MSEPSPYDLPDKAAEPDAFKARIQRFYQFWNKRMDQSEFGEMSLFMNWGYWSDGTGEASIEPSSNAVNISSVRLILELVGPVPLDGRQVLDIGCGRGGTVHTMLHYFRPATVTGLDLTPANIAFCRRAIDDPRACFLEGDAEALPFTDSSFDVVSNIESSHCYPDIGQFYREVFRVLKPGGTFIYTDVFDMEFMPHWQEHMRDAGLVLQSDRDITPQVMRARAEEGFGQADALTPATAEQPSAQADADVLNLVMARPGTDMYEAMMRGQISYRILRATRPAISMTQKTLDSLVKRAARQRRPI